MHILHTMQVRSSKTKPQKVTDHLVTWKAPDFPSVTTAIGKVSQIISTSEQKELWKLSKHLDRILFIQLLKIIKNIHKSQVLQKPETSNLIPKLLEIIIQVGITYKCEKPCGILRKVFQQLYYRLVRKGYQYQFMFYQLINCLYCFFSAIASIKLKKKQKQKQAREKYNRTS